MRFTHRDIAAAKTASRQMPVRVSLLVLLLVSVGLLVAERQGREQVDSLRYALLDALLPVADLLNSPAQTISNAGARINHMMALFSENSRLREENARLRQWQAVALQMEADNRSLRSMLHYQPAGTRHYISARVIGNAEADRAGRVHINAGTLKGVERWQPVMNAHGLIGRVIHVTPHHSEVLLIGDVNSHIPVRLEPSGVKAILSGSASGSSYIALTQHNGQPQEGDTVLSAEDGQVLPGGMMIGRLKKHGDNWQVDTAAQEGNLRFVRVVDLSR